MAFWKEGDTRRWVRVHASPSAVAGDSAEAGGCSVPIVPAGTPGTGAVQCGVGKEQNAVRIGR